MIRIETTDGDRGGIYIMMIYGEVDNGMLRRRFLGQIIRYIGEPHEAWVNTDKGPRNIGNARSVPDGIETILSFHKLTDYQYAPWPTMEDDEE